MRKHGVACHILASLGCSDYVDDVARISKTLDSVLRGNADRNIRFSELCALLSRIGFTQRIRGVHHIFTKDGVVEILNIQSKDGNAKAYQVKQIRNVLVKYNFTELGQTDSNRNQPDQPPDSDLSQEHDNER